MAFLHFRPSLLPNAGPLRTFRQERAGWKPAAGAEIQAPNTVINGIVTKTVKDGLKPFPKPACVGTYRSHPLALARVAFSGSLRTGLFGALGRWLIVARFRPFEGAQRFIAGWSSPVARQAHNLKVIGSNPIPATKIDTKNPAISMDCWVFVFKTEPSPQQNQWLSFVGSNHPQPIAECISAAGERR